MTRLISCALVLAPALVSSIASAHPGHGTPHLLHEGDAALGWWVFVGVAAAAGLSYALAKWRP
jgi:hypothetical protein